MPTGRRTELTKELQKKMVEIVASGNTMSTAYGSQGVSESAFYLWMKTGEDAHKLPASKRTPYQKKCLEFMGNIKKARNEAKQRYQQIVYKEAPKDWRCSAWWLERNFPDEYALVSKVERTENIQHNVKVDATIKVELSEERAEKIATIVQGLIPLPASKGANGRTKVE